MSAQSNQAGQRLAESAGWVSEMWRWIWRQTLDLIYSSILTFSVTSAVKLSSTPCMRQPSYLGFLLNCSNFTMQYGCNHFALNIPRKLLRGVQRAEPYFLSVSVASYRIRSAGCLQSEAVNKGFVEAAKQRGCDHSCLRCTSAAVMFPRGHNKKSLSIWGQAVNHSQQGRCTSQPKSVASWCMNPPPKTMSLQLSHYKTNKRKS